MVCWPTSSCRQVEHGQSLGRSHCLLDAYLSSLRNCTCTGMARMIAAVGDDKFEQYLIGNMSCCL